MRNHVVIFEARGGTDKGEFGFRKDSKAIIDALKERGRVFEKHRVGVDENSFFRKQDPGGDGARLAPMGIAVCAFPLGQDVGGQGDDVDRPALKRLGLVSH